MTVAALLPTHAAEPRAADARGVQMLGRNLGQKAAGRVGLHRAKDAPGAGIGEVQAPLRAGDGHVGQAAFLLDRGAVALVRAVRKEPLLHAGHKDHGKLQALGGVDGHHGDGARLAGQRVEVAAQGEPLHERGQLLGRHLRQLGRGSQDLGRRSATHHACLAQLAQALERLGHIVVGLVELLRHAKEFLDVLDAGVGLYGVLGLERADETSLLHDHLHHVGEVAGIVATGLHGAAELGKAVARLGGQKPRLGDAGLCRREERGAIGRRVGAYLGHRGGTDAAARRVDHALGAHIVIGVDHQLEVGHHVADLGTVKEARAAHDLVGHARAQEHVFERARLRVGAVEHGHVVVAGARVVQLLDLGTDPASLVALVGGLKDLDALAVTRAGVEALGLAAGVVGHHRIGRLEDVPGRAVVLLELDHGGGGVVLAEGQDVADVGTTPAVDGLVVVAHHHEVAVARGQQVGDLVLHVVGVLILVHADLAEAFLVALQHLGVLGQQLVGVDQQIVEVHGVGAGQATLQRVVHAGRGTLLRRAGVGLHLVGAHQRVLGRADERANAVERCLLGVDVKLRHDGLDQAAGVVVIVDREVGAVPQKLAVLAQDTHAHGVEGADPHATGAAGQQTTKTLAHLGGRLVGKGDGQHLPRPNALVGDHMRDAVREHARLARASACQHQKRPLGAHHRLVLRRVEPIEIDRGRGRRVRRRGYWRVGGLHRIGGLVKRKERLLACGHGTP